MSNHLCLQGLIRNCRDLDGLKNWYVEQLGLTPAWEQRYSAAWISELFPGTVAASLDCCALRLGPETLWLMSWPEVLMQPMPAATRGIDHWFQHICLVSDALEKAYAGRLQGACRPISTSPQTLPDWNLGAAGIQAVKFFDLEGHPLELLQFPPGKGAPRWHVDHDRSGQPRGIDHTAISIADTTISLSFYSELLGLQRVGGGLNHGPEQDALDGLESARVEITALQAQPGQMGVEFLHYQSPRGGMGRADARWSDLVNDTMVIQVDGIHDLHARAQASPWAQHCSPLVPLPLPLFGGEMGFTLRDPDLHGVLLVGEDR